uniref:SNF7 family protein n=1 Tax=Zea mays TaxID=4577 RepID=A0A804N2D9_MAIZE
MASGEGWEAAVRAEVGAVAWWDDLDSADLRARFKAFTGQRSDWPQPTVLFWKDLLLRVARRLRVCSAPAHHEEMRADGDVLLKSELIDPSSTNLHQLVRRVRLMTISSRKAVWQEDILVFKLLIEERAADIARQLSDSHWTSTCVVTISKFNSFFVDMDDAHIALCFLTQHGKARYLLGRKQDPIELDSCLQGVKVALTASQVPAVSKLDHDTLHLVWTEEKLQEQLDVLDRRWEISRRRALASFKSGDKLAAYRYVRQSKLFSQSRSRCTQLLERIEEVISLIASAESNKKVYEAIQIGILAMKDNTVSIDEVNIHMKEIDELVAAQREVDAALVPLQSLDDEGDIDEEFSKLEAELQDDVPHIHVQEPMAPSNEESPDEVVLSSSFHKVDFLQK